MKMIARIALAALLIIGLGGRTYAQVTYVPFTSGPIPPCDTSTFTANVAGIGTMYPPGMGWWTYWIESLTINITSNHPQTLQISLTSPAGTTLLLSAFNGAGGQNYTNTSFSYWNGHPSITTGTAPFTGYWVAQGGLLNVFDYENADGTWTITVIDTACANGGTGPGGTWTPGWFVGSGGNGGFAFGFDSGPPPCWGGIPSDNVYLCPGETFDLQAYYNAVQPQYNYTFQFGWSPVTDPTAVSAAGSYQIEATDPWDNCWYWASFEVYVSPQIALGPDLVVDQCSGAGPVDLPALFSLGGVWQTWSLNGAVISNSTAAAATAPGVYQLIGQNLGGCGDTVLVTLNTASAAVLGADQTVSLCAGANTDLTALYPTTGLTTQWMLGGLPFSAPTAATTPGVYTLVATTAQGCTDTAQVTLTTTAMPALGVDQTAVVCSNASLDLSSLFITTGFAVTWTQAGTPVSDPSAVNAAGTYQLVASNGPSCTDTALVIVNVLSAPALGPDVSATTCTGNTIDLTFSFVTAGLTTTWTTGGAIVPDPATVSNNGVYTVIATDGSGCTDTANVNVNFMPSPVLGPDVSVTQCDGTMVDLTALYVTGANAADWTVNGVPVMDATSVSTSGNYTLTVTNASGCMATAIVTVSFDPAPALGPDRSLATCDGSTVDLTTAFSTAGLTTTWTLGGAAVIDPTNVSVAGSYQLVATNGFGCSDIAVATFSVDPAPELGVDLSFALCPWQTVDLTAVFPVGGMTATYTLNGVAVVDPSAVQEPGTYAVVVVDANGCTDEALATLENIECLCVADFIQEYKCLEDPVSFTLLADSMVMSASWDFSGAATGSTDVDPVVRFDRAEEVLVTLQVTLSCGVVNVEHPIRVPSCADSCSLWIPNAFTPNGDTRNETWAWKSECRAEEFSAQVYNRLGELIFASNDPDTWWDGTYRGVASPSGVYVYRVGYRLPYQEHKEVTGSVMLMR